MLAMSFPGYPYPEGGYSSMPTTPGTPWDTEQNMGSFQPSPQEIQQLQSQQPPQFHHTPPQQEFFDPQQQQPPPPPPIQTIQLEERVPIVPSQRLPEEHERERARVLSQQRREGRTAEGRVGASSYKPHIQVDTSLAGPSSAGASATGPVRLSPTTRGQSHRYDPYRRPSSGAGKPRRDRDTEQHVRFNVGQGQPPQGSMSAPSSAPSRIASLGSTIVSTSSSNQPGSGRTSPQQEPARRYLIRADVHYDAEKRVLTASLELPGLTKRDLSITLSTCLYNRVRQLVVAGRSKRPMPEAGYPVKERRFGEFTRTLCVPPDTKGEDISAELQDGLLVIKISLGPPADSDDLHEIAIQ